jgi:hypothetical protein
MQNKDSNHLPLWQVSKALLEQGAAEERAFWTCPTTGRDCRHEARPALAIIEDREAGTTTLRMYASEELADSETPHSVEVWPGIPADYLLKKWLHYGAKAWVDAKGLGLAMSRLAWRFVEGLGGDRSGASDV